MSTTGFMAKLQDVQNVMLLQEELKRLTATTKHAETGFWPEYVKTTLNEHGTMTRNISDEQ